MALIDRIRVGQRFGKWMVIGFGITEGQCQRYRTCLCQCSCGAQRAIPPANLVRRTSMGCNECRYKAQRRVKIGDRFGKRVVTQINRNLSRWRCDCGREGETASSRLATTTSCLFCREKIPKAIISIHRRKLTIQDCCDLLGVSRQRLYQLRKDGRLRERLRVAAWW